MFIQDLTQITSEIKRVEAAAKTQGQKEQLLF